MCHRVHVASEDNLYVLVLSFLLWGGGGGVPGIELKSSGLTASIFPSSVDLCDQHTVGERRLLSARTAYRHMRLTCTRLLARLPGFMA